MAKRSPFRPVKPNGEAWTAADMNRAAVEMTRFKSSEACEWLSNYIAVQMSWCEKDIIPASPEKTDHGRYIALASRHNGLNEFFKAVDYITSFRESGDDKETGSETDVE